MVVEFTGPTPIFHQYRIEEEIERLHSRYVPLRSGGSLVIDQTEALVAIDVNSGRFRNEDDPEETAFKINCEAADEIARQLRLRDLGGVIVCDFIDMRMDSHRREVEHRLIKNLKEHKERAKVLRFSAFGIIEMTRQRQRASITRSMFQACTHCDGTGHAKTAESVALDVMRHLQYAATRDSIHNVEVTVSPEVAYLLQNQKRKPIYEIEVQYRRTILIRSDPSFAADRVEYKCSDLRGRPVPLL
jgi:ribonuclease E